MLAMDKKTIYATSSTRRAHSTGSKYRWVISIDRRDLLGTAWEVKTGATMYFTCHPSPTGTRFIILRRYYNESKAVVNAKDLPKSVHTMSLQDGHRVRLWTDLAYFRQMEGDPDTVIDLHDNGDLYAYYPQGLSTGKKSFDDIMHGRNKNGGESSRGSLIKETTTIVREYDRPRRRDGR
jgi:hypothetical protein